MERYKFFAIEGIDGSGKSTQARILKQRLIKRGKRVFVSKACPQGKKGELISFMRSFGFDMNSIAGMFLFQALHRHQYEETMKALRRNEIVIADRWNASFWIYHQKFGPLRDFPGALDVIDKIAFQGLVPTVIFLLDLPVEVSIRRKEQFMEEDIYERKSLGVYLRAREYYQELASENENWVIVDANRSIKEVQNSMWDVLVKHL